MSNIRNEKDLSRAICKRHPLTKVIENSVSVGTPDICLPHQNGYWFWAELKIFRGLKLHFKKSQIASLSKEAKMPLRHQSVVIAYDMGTETAAAFAPHLILSYHRQPNDRGVEILPVKFKRLGLNVLLDSLGVYSPNNK